MAESLSRGLEPAMIEVITLSWASRILADGMFGNLPRAEPITGVKRRARRLRVYLRDHRAAAGKKILEAVKANELQIHAIESHPSDEGSPPSEAGDTQLFPLPSKLACRSFNEAAALRPRKGREVTPKPTEPRPLQ